MKLFNSKKTVVSEQKADGCHLPFSSFWQHKVQIIFSILGDEFITLSCCAYHVEDGRFVVVGKRVL